MNSSYWATRLSNKLGYNVWAGEPYYIAASNSMPGCSSNSQCVFPNAIVPSSAWSSPARNLLPYIPQPNVGLNHFSNSSENETLSDNKAAARVDVHTHFGDLAAYYFFDQYRMNNPYPTAQGGANVPGFNALSDGRAEFFSLSLSRPYGANTIHEAHFSYMRYANLIGQPVGESGHRWRLRVLWKVRIPWASSR